MIGDGSCCALSLDVFDTLLWRRVPRPTDLFAVLGARLRRDGIGPGWMDEAAFRRIRIEAEQLARRLAPTSEVSLFDIWRHMPVGTFTGASLQQLVDFEVALERELTEVDQDVAELVGLAESSEIPILLVSDTYFTDIQLTELLDRPGLSGLKAARQFRSCQHGADKASGLWEIVLDSAGVRPEQLVHLGDHPEGDDRVPAELGVRTVLYRRGGEGFAELLEREHNPVEPLGAHDPVLDAEHGDFGITALRAKALQTGSGEASLSADAAWRFGAGVLGPVLTGFAEWAARRGHEEGTPVLWCPMREGELLSELVNASAAARGWNVRAAPVWLSRQVTSLAGLEVRDPQAVHDFVRRSYRLTVAQLLATLKIRPGEVPSLAQHLHSPLDGAELVDRVGVALTETPHLRNRLATTVTATRERLLGHLRRTGALDGPEITLVDLGWGGTIQYQLAHVLRMSGIGNAVSGLYLATDERSTRVVGAGMRIEGYLGTAGHPSDLVRAVSRSPEIVEQSTSALCGSLVDFEDSGAPVLGPAAGGQTQHQQRTAVQDGVRRFQALWLRQIEGGEGVWPELTGAARQRLRSVLSAALRTPNAEEAALFGNWEHDDNFGSSVVTRLLPDDLLPAVPYMSPNDLDELHMRDAFWPGLIAASDPQLSAARRAVESGALDGAAFEPHGRAESELRFRTADGEWHDGPRKRVRVNHNGLSFARFNASGAGITDVSLAIPGQPAVVRLDWVSVEVQREGTPERAVLHWDEPGHYAGLTHAECTWLGGNLIEFEHPHSAVWLPITSAGPPASSVTVTVAFAMLPQSVSRLAPRMPPAPAVSRLRGRLLEEYRTAGVRAVAAGAARVAARQLKGEK
nr:HAD family hydrolase [Saccharopolyspora sp. HNM0983]